MIQSHDFDCSRIRTAIGATITSNLKLAAASGNVDLPKRGTGLSKRSVVNVSRIVTLEKSFLTERAGRATEAVLRLIFSL